MGVGTLPPVAEGGRGGCVLADTGSGQVVHGNTWAAQCGNRARVFVIARGLFVNRRDLRSKYTTRTKQHLFLQMHFHAWPTCASTLSRRCLLAHYDGTDGARQPSRTASRSMTCVDLQCLE